MMIVMMMPTMKIMMMMQTMVMPTSLSGSCLFPSLLFVSHAAAPDVSVSGRKKNIAPKPVTKLRGPS